MVGENDLGAIGNKEIAIDFHARGAQGSDFLQKSQRIDHHSIADDAGALGPQNAAGHQLQDKLLAVDDDRVSGVVAAGVARHYRKSVGKNVDNLALALVAPLGSDNDCGSASARAAFAQGKLHLKLLRGRQATQGSHTLAAPLTLNRLEKWEDRRCWVCTL